MVSEYDQVGIGIDNNCMIVYQDDGYRILASEEGAQVHRIVSCTDSSGRHVEIVSLGVSKEKLRLEHLYGK